MLFGLTNILYTFRLHHTLPRVIHQMCVVLRKGECMHTGIHSCCLLRSCVIFWFSILQAPNQDIEEEDGFERDNSGKTWLHWAVRRTEPLECLQVNLYKAINSSLFHWASRHVTSSPKSNSSLFDFDQIVCRSSMHFLKSNFISPSVETLSMDRKG